MDSEERDSNVDPGIHPQVLEGLSRFSDDEQKIIKRLGKDWYVTNSGNQLNLGPSSFYQYILVKPVDIFQEMFNLNREIVLLFSSYENFEPRTLDAITMAHQKHQMLRLERICSILVSRDPEIEYKLKELLKNDHEAQIVVPFTYSELINNSAEPFFFRNRFKKHFFTRDLFASEAPLKKDLYFFGRTDLVHSLVNRHRSNQVSGLFGLRKTGKTSVIFSVQRALEKVDAMSSFIDCQSPSFHRSRWNKSLFYVLSEIKKQHNLGHRLGKESDYTEENASVLFETNIQRMSKSLGDKNILLIFDEIENITPGVSPSDHWKNGQDFIYFWQTLRSSFQKLPKVFSYLIVGTNPLCVETEKICGFDNPIFGQIPIEYIPRFDVPQTREMVRRLGRIMGLKFDEILYGTLTEDFGGHPYLIRHICSVINTTCPSDRPIKVDKSIYKKAKRIFLRDYSHFFEMILNVLKDSFNDEYEMLLFLSRGDFETFKEFAEMSPLYTNHLIGYGIIEENQLNHSFRIETIESYLKEKQKYKKLSLSQEEMLNEISQRRNFIENKLRQLARMQLLAQLGASKARDAVIKIMGEPRATKNSGLSYTDLFDGNVSGIFFSDLIKIITKHWECFKNILGSDKEDITLKLNLINKLRVDALAKKIKKDEFQLFRVSIEKLEESITNFLG